MTSAGPLPLNLALEDALRRALTPEAPSSRPSNWASQLSKPCGRQRVLWRTLGEKAVPMPPEVIGIVEEGKRQQRSFEKLLEEWGFEVVKDRRKSRWTELQIGASTDFWIRAYNAERRPIERLCEFKAPKSPWVWRDVVRAHAAPPEERVARLYEDDYLHEWADQLNLYLLIEEAKEPGLLIVKEPGSINFLTFDLPLDWDRADVLVKNALADNKRVVAWNNTHDEALLPPYIGDSRVCARCPFFGARGGPCFPPFAPPGTSELAADLSADELFMAKVRRRFELEALHREYEQLDDEVKDRLRPALERLAGAAEQGTLLLAGVVASGTYRRTTRVDTKAMPEDVRKAYTRTDPRGSFVVKIEDLSAKNAAAAEHAAG